MTIYIAWLNGTSVARGEMDSIRHRALKIFFSDAWQQTHQNKITTLRITKGARQQEVSSEVLNLEATIDSIGGAL